ncbi:MAG: hypothetical protein KKB95_01560 [Gammaproteobacteria bacterium]|jgi:DNA-directed RNA polymerase subunit RPC12/RpoP|nr:hypothetical protein [Gammaproteobacteria bacterium]MBU1504561.1 hypothetical protein [Gammaproteobacteria bacterium]MBU2119423.1 hypothetical protein [Gammaproteobacteria bacterium]MBU2202810.1 hypothetical protein [Gammaproteobacteria bacterium]MBU2272549.1 hypothetical protein [Gammaproteobacteria bacterium]
MKTFKHHSYFAKPRADQQHFFPYVCFNCRKAFRKPDSDTPRLCPQCRAEMVMLNRKFSAPKMTDVEQWRKVEFLVGCGFRFQSVHEADGSLVRYPANMAEARAFAEKYAHRART